MNTRLAVVAAFACCAFSTAYAQVSGDDLGRLSANPHQPNSTGGADVPAGHPPGSISVNNPSSRYWSPLSNQSATNPYATEAPRLYDSNGNYRGRLSANRYDPDSTSNPFGRYGSRFSPDSINNHYGAGNQYDVESPGNPYGKGLRIVPGDTSAETPIAGQTQTATQSGQQSQQSLPQPQALESEQVQEGTDSATAAGDSTDSEAAQ
jgi:hypothetical protein